MWESSLCSFHTGFLLSPLLFPVPGEASFLLHKPALCASSFLDLLLDLRASRGASAPGTSRVTLCFLIFISGGHPEGAGSSHHRLLVLSSSHH